MIDAEEEERPVGTVPHAYEGHVEHNGCDGAVGAPVAQLDVQWHAWKLITFACTSLLLLAS